MVTSRLHKTVNSTYCLRMKIYSKCFVVMGPMEI